MKGNERSAIGEGLQWEREASCSDEKVMREAGIGKKKTARFGEISRFSLADSRTAATRRRKIFMKRSNFQAGSDKIGGTARKMLTLAGAALRSLDIHGDCSSRYHLFRRRRCVPLPAVRVAFPCFICS